MLALRQQQPGAETNDRRGAYDGYVQNAGDGIFALFGRPSRIRTIRRGLRRRPRMQQGIHRYGDRLLQGCGAPEKFALV